MIRNISGQPDRQHRACADYVEFWKAQPGLRPDDLLINLVEVNWENWSFGNGKAQYMDA